MNPNDRIMFTNCTRFESWEIITVFDPAAKETFEENFSAWSDEFSRPSARVGDNLSLLWDLAVKYGGAGDPRRVFGWLAAGIFQEFFTSLGELSSHEEMKRKATWLLDMVGKELDDKFLRDERYPREKTLILSMIQNKLEQFYRKPGPVGPPISPQRYEFLRRSIIGSSPRLTESLDRAARAARFNVSVLITGETGVGKELFAAFIHQASPRAKMPFVAVNCSAISPHLLESELFGHERGAFTGATSIKKGLVEVAHGGTLFLDEVGDLHPDHQTKILRFLQEGMFRRVGGLRDLKVDVRVIAATNRNLQESVQRERFRQDLFYRLAIVPIQVPPLRDRSTDIPALSRHFLDEFTQRESLPDMHLAPAVLALLKKHTWPGNVRELKSIILESAVMCKGVSIELSDLPSRLLKKAFSHQTAAPGALFLDVLIQQIEARPGLFNPVALTAALRKKSEHFLKRSSFQSFLRLLIGRGGLSFRSKDVVDYFAENNIGTRESRIKLARQVLKECRIIQHNRGKTKQHRMRLAPVFLVPPFPELLPRLDSALGEIEDIGPDSRYIVEDFFLEHFDAAFSEEAIRTHLGAKSSRIMTALKKKIIFADPSLPSAYRFRSRFLNAGEKED